MQTDNLRNLSAFKHLRRQSVFPTARLIPWASRHVRLVRSLAADEDGSGSQSQNEKRKESSIHGRNLAQNHVAFHHFAVLPLGQEISDAAGRLGGGDLDLADQLAVAADKHFATGFDALIGADV